ncbi:hypothetical protein E2C01_055985 [Portunus trituberculatus]|uniref:Uncharacterized protein n=1 Tax=Portunus trituberculatus TaxID=210409 RepID=A0A5B7GYF1_PORTR|nr:hypothetical protein [Portunus trituberculatus]
MQGSYHVHHYSVEQQQRRHCFPECWGRKWRRPDLSSFMQLPEGRTGTTIVTSGHIVTNTTTRPMGRLHSTSSTDKRYRITTILH